LNKNSFVLSFQQQRKPNIVNFESNLLKIREILHKSCTFSSVKHKLHFRYYNERLKLGMVDIKNVYQLEPELMLLYIEVYRGKLVYRAKGSSRRISYEQVKKGLVKKSFSVEEEVPDWLLC
jgi:hypothetical protein